MSPIHLPPLGMREPGPPSKGPGFAHVCHKWAHGDRLEQRGARNLHYPVRVTTAGPSTTGMASSYTANSDFQRDSAASAIPQINELVAAVLHRNTDRAFTLVDYGTGPGSSGLALFATVINEVRQADSAREVTVVHQDLPGNAWGDLLTRLRQDPDSYLAGDAPPPVLAAVGSFYRRSLPPGSVHFGMSFMAAHWLSVQERPLIRSSAALVDADSAEELRIAADAATDWQEFWRCREDELASGGAIIVKCIGSLEDRRKSTSHGLLEMLGGAFQAAAEAGLISQQAADGYVLSEYPRTESEARAPFDAGLVRQLRLDSAEVHPEPDPYRAQYEEDRDASGYARALVGFVRAFTESSVRRYLVHHRAGAADPGQTVDDVVDWIYRWCQDRWSTDPESHPFEAWTLTVIAHRV
ncbi:MAG: hypothetical protein QG671_687 [Actinomycetota bacterium]|nr:hypothetical protein [Actinomycetota bacterium]